MTLMEMVQLRYVVPDGTHVPPSIPRLQYRFVTPSVDSSGALCPPGVWSEWKDVPVVLESAA